MYMYSLSFQIPRALVTEQERQALCEATNTRKLKHRAKLAAALEAEAEAEAEEQDEEVISTEAEAEEQDEEVVSVEDSPPPPVLSERTRKGNLTIFKLELNLN